MARFWTRLIVVLTVILGVNYSRFSRYFQHLGFGPVMSPEQIRGDAEKPGPGILPAKVVGFELFPSDQKGFGRDVVRREVAGPSGGVSVDD